MSEGSKALFVLRVGSPERGGYMYWAGDDWWTRRTDHALTFTEAEAEKMRATAVLIVKVEEPDGLDQKQLKPQHVDQKGQQPEDSDGCGR